MIYWLRLINITNTENGWVWVAAFALALKKVIPLRFPLLLLVLEAVNIHLKRYSDFRTLKFLFILKYIRGSCIPALL